MIRNVLFGETGATPVRARRRETWFYLIGLTGRHNPGKCHWSKSEKAGRQNVKSKYPNIQNSLFNITARAGFGEN